MLYRSLIIASNNSSLFPAVAYDII